MVDAGGIETPVRTKITKTRITTILGAEASALHHQVLPNGTWKPHRAGSPVSVARMDFPDYLMFG